MILIDNIQPLWFFASLFIGLFLVYIITPTPEIIVKYPTPENANNSIFVFPRSAVANLPIKDVFLFNGTFA